MSLTFDIVSYSASCVTLDAQVGLVLCCKFTGSQAFLDFVSLIFSSPSSDAIHKYVSCRV